MKPVRQLIGIVTEFLTTKNSLYLTILTLITLTAPSWHSRFVNQEPGIFGFKYMSSFLYAIGNNVTILGSGLLILFFSNRVSSEYKKLAKVIAALIITLASYSLIIIFFPKKVLLNAFGVPDLPKWAYMSSMIIMSLISFRLFSLFQEAFLYSESKMKEIIKGLFDFVLLEVPDKGMVKDERKGEYHDKSVELLKNALDNE